MMSSERIQRLTARTRHYAELRGIKASYASQLVFKDRRRLGQLESGKSWMAPTTADRVERRLDELFAALASKRHEAA